MKKELMGRPLESSPLLRILAVGWGTMVGTTLLVFLRLMDGPVGQSNMFEVGLHSLGYGSAFAILISIPVLAFWSRIYPRISFAVRSSKTAACLTAAMTAAIGMLVLGLLIGIGSASFIGGLNVVLVWGLAPVALAATLAWFAFKSEQFTGGQ